MTFIHIWPILTLNIVLGVFMDFHRLKYFCTVAETGSLTKASKFLGISHSGLSKAISLLQQEYEKKLFVPVGRGLEITDEGKILYQKACEILSLVNNLKNNQTEIKKTVRFGLSEVLSVTTTAYLMKELEPLSAMVHQLDVGDIEAQITKKNIDFGFSFVPLPRQHIEYLSIGKVTLNSYCHKNMLKKYSGKTIPYAVPTSEYEDNPMGYKKRDGWTGSTSRNPHYFMGNFSMSFQLLKNEVSAAYIPDFVANLVNNKNKTYKLVKIPDHKNASTEREVFLVKLKNKEETKDMKKVTKVIRKLIKTKG